MNQQYAGDALEGFQKRRLQLERFDSLCAGAIIKAAGSEVELMQLQLIIEKVAKNIDYNKTEELLNEAIVALEKF